MSNLYITVVSADDTAHADIVETIHGKKMVPMLQAYVSFADQKNVLSTFYGYNGAIWLKIFTQPEKIHVNQNEYTLHLDDNARHVMFILNA